MSLHVEQMAAQVEARLAGRLVRRASLPEELSYDVAAADLVAVATVLRDEAELHFEILIDVLASTTWITGAASGALSQPPTVVSAAA